MGYLFLIAIPAVAGTQTGKVDNIIVRASDGLIYFVVTGGSKVNSPDCARIGYWIIKDEHSNAEKQQYSMLLSAHASGKTIKVPGSNTCSRWPDGEDVDFIILLQ